METENSKLEAEVERMQAALAADKSMANAAHKALASASQVARSWSENLGIVFSRVMQLVLWLIVLCRAEPVLLAAGERVAKQLPAAMRVDDMEWEDVGKAEEEDVFLVEWKAEVRRMSDEMHNHPSECVQSLSGVTASRRCALCCSPCATTWRNAAASFRLYSPTSSTWQRRQRQSGSSHHRFITNCHPC
jgi:hypothetical protein